MKPEKKDILWYDNAVIYQIYPLSFKDSNGDGFGDIKGIIEKLDYLEWLGITAVWLTPIYPSPLKDFGYDISDYNNIDSRFGTLEDFDELIKQAHLRNIKIIVDFVTNHTSSEHPWFLESKSSKNNPKRDWYVWKDATEAGTPPNNWLAVSGGPAWNYDQPSGQYYLHQFLAEQPDLNWRNPQVREVMKEVMIFWINRGVDGFRIDAVSHMIEDAEFRNEPFDPASRLLSKPEYDNFLHLYSKNRPELNEVVAMFSEIAHAYKDIFIVSEVYLGPEDLLHFYRICPYHNQAPFNFNLVNLPWDAESYRAAIDVYEKILDPEDMRVYALGNHDLPRLASRIGKEHTRAAALLLLTLPGMPFIYYGEEIGMENSSISKENLRDTFTHENSGFTRDQSRTPMQWSAGTQADFTTGTPWLPSTISPPINVASEKNDPASLLTLYKNLINAKLSLPELQGGSYVSFSTESKNILGYVRSTSTSRCLIYINFSGEMQKINLPKGTYKIYISTDFQKESGEKIKHELILSPHEAILLQEN